MRTTLSGCVVRSLQHLSKQFTGRGEIKRVDILAGVDGYKKRWLAALLAEDGTTQLEVIGSFAELVRRSKLDLIVIDMPIGLPKVGARRCDLLARQRIGPRRSSVFPAPVRAMLGAATYEEAGERRRQVEAKGCSKQLFAILPPIESMTKW